MADLFLVVSDAYQKVSTCWVDFWKPEHKTERIYAIIVGIVLGIPLAIAAEYFTKAWSRLWKWIYKKIKRVLRKPTRYQEYTVQENEVNTSLRNCLIDKQRIVYTIVRHQALVQSMAFHYADTAKNYHTRRKLNLFPVLDGGDGFFRELCQALIPAIDTNNTDLILYNKKATNELFANEFGRNFLKITKQHSLIHTEKKNFFKSSVERKIDYESGESLDGVRVVLIESLFVFPDTLTETIRWLRTQGAQVTKVVILFDGSGMGPNYDFLGIRSADVVVGCRIDLKMMPAAQCDCRNKILIKPIKYDNI